ncbi:MAG: AAA+ family ATPase [Firmicutes bacterium HGW-Firmicutes-12]|jgi:hypothetical protein|nr:MAG: AAA+ family ATPase [Firmicutes bacterium HGW-Firmicutes-12]
MDKQIAKAVQAEWGIVLYAEVMEDKLVKKLVALLKEAVKPDPDCTQLTKMYSQFSASFIPKAAELSIKGKNAWKVYLLDLLLSDENTFTLLAEAYEFEKMPAELKKIAEQDLSLIQSLASFSIDTMREILSKKTNAESEVIDRLPDWDGICVMNNEKKSDEISSYFYGLSNWERGLEKLSKYYYNNGAGQFGEYHTLRWVRKNDSAELVGVKNTDIVQMNQLYEYEREQAKIIQNTEQFLQGYSGNNVLLYGDRGTGKSSTVKALVNKFGSQGLRLIELQKQDIADYPQIISKLVNRPQKFILFIDDLSFNDNEGQYREMKALLEGGVEVKPKNVLVYATSNRRHLVYEKHSDREYTGGFQENDEVRRMDTLQEKLSLADRFGIAVTFAAPDQKRYLTIVEKLALERGLDISLEELRQLAIKWEMSYNVRSGRTARQFVDFLEGQLALENVR